MKRCWRAEIEFCIESGVGGLVVPVMVSEFRVLSEDERRTMMRVPVEVGGRTGAHRRQLRRGQHAAGGQLCDATPKRLAPTQ